jgi:hypothetical protein
MAHIHFTGRLVASAEEDAYARGASFYVRLMDEHATRAYLPARDAAHAHAIAAAINGEARTQGVPEATAASPLAEGA